MDNIEDIVKSVIGQMAEKKLEDYQKIDRLWMNILNDSEQKHTKILGIKDGMVSVVVDSPAWLYQMNIKKNNILKELQAEIPNIDSIRFRIGKIT